MEREKIDPEKEGIGMTGVTMANGMRAPDATVNGKRLYRRIFVRLKTPQETLTCRPVRDGKDFAERVSVIESWFDSVIRKGNYVLTFYAAQVTDEEADELEQELRRG